MKTAGGMSDFGCWVKKLAVGVGLCAAAMAVHAEGQLNMYNWSDYIAEDTVPNFEKEFGIKMRYDTFDSNEILHAKLVAGKTGYDIVVPSSNWGFMQGKGGLLTKIDKSKIPNYKNLDPDLMALISKLDTGNTYLIPWMWGYTTIGINVDKVKKALGDLPMPDDAFSLVFDPKYANRLKSCGISFLDSGQDIMEAALLYLKIPQATNNTADFNKAWAALKEIRSDVSLFSSSGYINDMAGGSICVALGWSGDINIAKQRALEAKNGNNIQVLIPKSGAVIFVDTMAIPSDATNVDNAYKFINYRLRPEVSGADTNKVFYANPVPSSLKFVKPEVANNKTLFLSKEDLAKLVPPRGYTNDQRRLVTRAYTSFKTGV